MARRVTSHDVARRAGVSRATVSMVLSRSSAASFSDETRERVLTAAADLGYQPNSAARMLVRGDTETVGLVISDPSILQTDAFVPQLLYGVGQVNRAYGYRVLVEGLEPQTGRDTYASLVEAQRIDGLIVLNPRTDDPDLRALIERGFPVVLAGTIGHELEHSVNFSAIDGMTEAAAHVVGLGHRRIGMVTFSPRGLVGTDERIAVLRKVLAAHGIDLADADIEPGDFSAESGAAAAKRLLSRRPDLTAVFAGNDTIAIGVASGARAAGWAVPDDLSIVGFDDLPFAGYLEPALTTIRIEAVLQGTLAANMLVKRLRREPIAERRITMPTELIVRQSTAPPRSR